jgi:hypothetical protein
VIWAIESATDNARPSFNFQFPLPLALADPLVAVFHSSWLENRHWHAAKDGPTL